MMNLIFSIIFFLLNNAIGKAVDNVVVAQLKHKHPSIVDELSQINAFQYAKSHGYQYRLVEMSLPANGDVWHPSWISIDVIRQTLSNQSVDYVLYIGPKIMLNAAVSVQDVVNQDLMGNDIFLSSTGEDCLGMMDEPSCMDGPLSLQLWRNSPFTHDLLHRWSNCVDDEDENCIEYQYQTTPFAFGVLIDLLYPHIVAAKQDISYLPCNTRNDPRRTPADQDEELMPLESTLCSIIPDTDSQSAQPLAEVVMNYFPVSLGAELFQSIQTMYQQEILPQYQHTMTFRDGYCLPVSFLVNIPILQQTTNSLAPEEEPPIIVRNISILAKAYFKEHTSIDSCVVEFQLTPEQCHAFFLALAEKILSRREAITVCQANQFLSTVTVRQQARANLLAITPSIPPRFVPARKVIVTIFAGRYDRLQLSMKYWKIALSKGLVQEIHLWDYCRNASDRMQLMSFVNEDMIDGQESSRSSRIQVKTRSTNRRHWVDYYEYYDLYSHSHPQDILIKCDDDIVFMDLTMLSAYLDTIVKNASFFGLLVPNIVNNGVIAHLQQQVYGMFPRTRENTATGQIEAWEFDYPTNGLEGMLWSSASKAIQLHEYFVTHWKQLLPSSYTPSTWYTPKLFPLTTRFSINFFAIRADQWYQIRDVGGDDELHLTVTLVKAGLLSNMLYSNFLVSHLSYGPQHKNTAEWNSTAMIALYERLYEEYMKHKGHLLRSQHKRKRF